MLLWTSRRSAWLETLAGFTSNNHPAQLHDPAGRECSRGRRQRPAVDVPAAGRARMAADCRFLARSGCGIPRARFARASRFRSQIDANASRSVAARELRTAIERRSTDGRPTYDRRRSGAHAHRVVRACRSDSTCGLLIELETSLDVVQATRNRCVVRLRAMVGSDITRRSARLASGARETRGQLPARIAYAIPWTHLLNDATRHRRR